MDLLEDGGMLIERRIGQLAEPGDRRVHPRITGPPAFTSHLDLAGGKDLISLSSTQSGRYTVMFPGHPGGGVLVGHLP